MSNLIKPLQLRPLFFQAGDCFQGVQHRIGAAARAAEIMQQMTVDMEEIGIIAELSNDVLVPDLGQQGTTGLSKANPPFGFSGRRWQAAKPPFHGVSRLLTIKA